MAAAYLHDIEHVFEKIRGGQKLWRVYSDISCNNLIAENMDTDLSNSASAETLSNQLSFFTGTVTIVLFESDKTPDSIKRGGQIRKFMYRYDLEKFRSAEKNQETIGKTIESMNFDILDRILNEREARHKSEMQAMQDRHEFLRRLDKIEAEKDNDRNPMIEGLITGLLPLLTGQTAMGAPIAKDINGFATPEVAESVDELSALVSEWASLEPNYLDHLKAVVNVCKNKPDLYRMALSSIKSL